MSDELVNITFDGHKLAVPKGTLLVEAARQIGLEIPVYCYHPKMKPVGACRVCVVEVEGQRRPIMTACTTTVMPDMVVHTQSENAIKAREGILEFLLINHPLDCPVCDRGGECDLQDFTLRYGPPTTRFVEQKRHFEKSKQVGRNVILDRERCIMCQRCVRFCDEIAMEEGLVIIERGNRSEIGTFEGRSFDSKFSGNVIELCPVGALTAKTYRFEARPWEQQHYAGIDNVSSIGSNITVDVRFDQVVRIRSRVNDEIDDGWLADDCRYSHLAIHSEDRITKPLLRDGADLRECSWSQALETLKGELAKEGATAGIIVGNRLSLEDGHSLLRLGRSVLETPHVVHEHAAEKISTEKVLTGRVNGCDQADLIVLLGCDPATTHHAFELRLKKGLRNKARLLCLGDQPVLSSVADYQALGNPAELWNKLLKGLKKKPKVKEEGLRYPKPRPWEAGGATSESWDELVEQVRGSSKILVVVQGDLDSQGLTNLPADVEDLGWNTEPHGLLHLRHGVNSLGLEKLGLLPEWAEEDAEGFKSAWGTFNATNGKSFHDLCQGATQVLLSFGCDPMAVAGAKKPPFLVAVATHPNQTTEQADLVLPLSTWVESSGVFVSTDGRVQFQRQAIVPVGDSRPAHQIAHALSEALEEESLPVQTPRELYAEIGQLHSAFAGATYRDFQTPGQVHWSYPQQADLGMPRPDLSAIPVRNPDAPMWMPAVPTGSKVEKASRLLRGQSYPAVPGQRDPREIAAMLGLSHFSSSDQSEPMLAASNAAPKAGYLPLRVIPASGAQPAGPTPAHRHHEIGVGRRLQVAVPTHQVALVENVDETNQPESAEAKA